MIRDVGILGLRHILKNTNSDDFPRQIGNPRQRMVIGIMDMYDYYADWDGRQICFISANSFPEYKYIRGKPVPSSIFYTNTLSDFDAEYTVKKGNVRIKKRKIENALYDTRRLVQFLIDEDIAHHQRFTGGKGFQIDIEHAPQKFIYEMGKSSSRTLKKLIRALQLFLMNRWKRPLYTMDKKVMGDPKRLRRMEFTQYFNRFGKTNGNTCIPLSDDQILDLSVSEIVKLSSNPRFILPAKSPYKRRTLFETLDMFGGKDMIEEQISTEQFAEVIDTEVEIKNDKEAEAFLLLVERLKPCIINEMKKSNPHHLMRLAFILFAKRVRGVNSRYWFNDLYERIGAQFRYVDLEYDEVRWDQINKTYDNSFYKSEPNCSTIKGYAEGFCLGEACPHYREDKE